MTEQTPAALPPYIDFDFDIEARAFQRGLSIAADICARRAVKAQYAAARRELLAVADCLRQNAAATTLLVTADGE